MLKTKVSTSVLHSRTQQTAAEYLTVPGSVPWARDTAVTERRSQPYWSLPPGHGKESTHKTQDNVAVKSPERTKTRKWDAVSGAWGGEGCFGLGVRKNILKNIFEPSPA